MNINLIKTIIISATTFAAGMAVGGGLMYKKGMRIGGQKIYKAGRTMYPDFDQKMLEYVKQ